MLDVNLSPAALSETRGRTYRNESILLVAEEHGVLLVNKHDGSAQKAFKNAHVVPVHPSSESSEARLRCDERHVDVLPLVAGHL